MDIHASSIRGFIELGWNTLWERVLQALPPPWRLTAFIVALTLATLLVLLYRLHRGAV